MFVWTAMAAGILILQLRIRNQRRNMITSTSNHQVKQLLQLQKKSKERTAQDVFVVEGPKMFQEVPQDRLLQVYASESFYNRNKELFGAARQVTVLSDRVFETVSDTRTPQGVLCVVRQFHYGLEALLGGTAGAGGAAGKSRTDGRISAASGGMAVRGQQAGQSVVRRQPLLLALENLQDPGNLGTIMRAAEGAGVTGILLSSGCVDLYNPKVIRSTMGSVYRMRFCYTDHFKRDLMALKERGVRLYAARLRGAVDYDTPDYCQPSCFLVGNESHGLTEETAELADMHIRIPMAGKVESLNAAVASALLAYETFRQRRNEAARPS